MGDLTRHSRVVQVVKDGAAKDAADPSGEKTANAAPNEAASPVEKQVGRNDGSNWMQSELSAMHRTERRARGAAEVSTVGVAATSTVGAEEVREFRLLSLYRFRVNSRNGEEELGPLFF